MSQTITISDETYQHLEQLAEQLGRPMADVVADLAGHGEFLLVEAKSRPVGKVFYSDEEFMQALGMSEESIARVMAAPVEPEPGEEYVKVDIRF
jgi:predicted CopG family antitoxin